MARNGVIQRRYCGLKTLLNMTNANVLKKRNAQRYSALVFFAE